MEQQRIEGLLLFGNSAFNLLGELKGEPNLGGGMGSMNEGIRISKYNYEDVNRPNTGQNNNNLTDNSNMYTDNLAGLNRNNIDRLSSQYTNNTEEVEKMIRNSIKEYQENNR